MSQDTHVGSSDSAPFREVAEVSGHIIDSLILPKILDAIKAAGGSFQILKIDVGQNLADPSFARIEVRADTEEKLGKIIKTISAHGATPVLKQDCRLRPVDVGGAFPESFYATTNQRTEIRVDGEWILVHDQEMDCGIVFDAAKNRARCLPMCEAVLGQSVVVGHAGVRVTPHERNTQSAGFEFMNSAVSTEKPKGAAVREIARSLFNIRRAGGKILLVGGPAIVHTGSGEYLSWLIRGGYLHRLFAGNALAVHDIEQAMFGTSLGVRLDSGGIVEAGHEHHLRAINRLRRIGGIRPAVEQGLLTSGIMYECVKNNIDYILAGSIRDDGPLPDVVTDALEAQSLMRAGTRDIDFCLMIATTLHSIAVGNLLPAWVKVVCVDINPSTVIKLNDRGSFQTTGLVTDVEPFLRALVEELKSLEAAP